MNSNILAIVIIIICTIIILFGLWVLKDTRKMKAKRMTNVVDESNKFLLKFRRRQSK